MDSQKAFEKEAKAISAITMIRQGFTVLSNEIHFYLIMST